MAVVAAICLFASACSESSGTSEIAADGGSRNDSAPTTSIVRTGLTTTTTLAPRPTVPRPAGEVDLVEVLATVAGAVASDPMLLQLLSGDLELPDIAELLGIDLGALAALELTPPDLEALAAQVLAQPAAVLEQLASTPPQLIDPGLIAALLASIPDPNALVGDLVAQITEQLFAALPDANGPSVGPQLQRDLITVLDRIDPGGLGTVVRDPNGAATVALLLSALLGENRALVDQLMAGGVTLNPSEAALVQQLLALNASLGDVANQILLGALGR
jgi:hypothetical protein